MSRYTEKFIERKAELFLEIRSVLKAVEQLLDTEESAAQGKYVGRVQILSNKFNNECQTAWYELMTEELVLHEQLEVTSGLCADDFNGNILT
jgi:hypothetical protein